VGIYTYFNVKTFAYSRKINLKLDQLIIRNVKGNVFGNDLLSLAFTNMLF